jgi:hypothetical protein
LTAGGGSRRRERALLVLAFAFAFALVAFAFLTAALGAASGDASMRAKRSVTKMRPSADTTSPTPTELNAGFRMLARWAGLCIRRAWMVAADVL